MKRTPILSYLNLISELGLVIGILGLGGLLIGIWLDGRFKTENLFSIVLLILGLTCGLIGSYRVIKKRD